MKVLFFISILLIALISSTIQTSSASNLEASEMRQPIWNDNQELLSLTPGYNASDGYKDLVCKGLMTFYSTTLRPVISSGCYCYPSCSEYMAQAIQSHGLPIGFTLGLERLLHEYGEYQYGTLFMTSEGWRIYDPVHNNTFWWSKLHVD